MSSAVQDHATLKSLQSRRDRLKVEMHETEIEFNTWRTRLDDTKAKLKKIEAEITRLTAQSAKVVVSEHALLRYIERVMGVDLDEVRSKILPDQVESLIQQFRSGVFPVHGNDFKLRVTNGVVVTVLTPEDDEKKQSA